MSFIDSIISNQIIYLNILTMLPIEDSWRDFCKLSFNFLLICNSVACAESFLLNCSCRSLSWSCKFLISPACKDMFYRALANCLVPSLGVHVVVVDVGITVRGTACDGIMALATSFAASFTASLIAFCLYFIIFSILLYIFLSCSACSMINCNISTFCVSFYSISLAIRSSITGILSFLLKAAMSAFFFLISASSTTMFDGSYLSYITRSSRDLILESLAMEDFVSTFSCDWVLDNVTCNFERLMVVVVRVEEIISPVCLRISIWSIGWMFFISNSK